MIRVQLFAVAREIAGGDFVDVEIDEPARVRDLAAALSLTVPKLARVVEHSVLAVDGELAPPEATIPHSADVALIPPVSGG